MKMPARLPRCLGSNPLGHPLVIAERAIRDASDNTTRKREAFVLTMGRDFRVWLDYYDETVNPSEWVATFTRKSNPDWIADEIYSYARELTR